MVRRSLMVIPSLLLYTLLHLSSITAASSSQYVSLAQDGNGVWWFEHNGNLFITKGVNHVNNGGMDDGVGGRESSECHPLFPLCGDTLSFSSTLKYAPYYNTTIARYGSADEWAANTKARLLQWGFNSMGGWSSSLMEGQGGVYYAHLLDIGTTWLRSYYLPDLFDPSFEQQCLQIAEKECAPRANDTNLLGYQTDNEIGWSGIHFLKTYLNFNSTAYGFAGAIAYLQKTYATVDALNTAWNISATSWDDIGAQLNNSKTLNTTAFNVDGDAFMGICATRYFSISTAAIKKYDSNHLILGARFADLPMPVLTALIPYVDLVDQHVYDFDPNVPWLQTIHQVTNKPVMIGEFSFTAVDSNMPNLKGAWGGNPLTTQSQRASYANSFVSTLMAQPFAVGYHWWQWADEPSSGRWPDGEDSNYGLVHIDDDEYQLLTQQWKATNAAVDTIHKQSHLSSSSPSSSSPPPLSPSTPPTPMKIM